MIDIKEIRARHAAAESDGRCGDIAWDEDYAMSAHMDRRDLLRALDKLLAWTEDDERGLNDAVADAMLYWDDKPMDSHDVRILTDILKIHLQDHGFCIANAALKEPGQ